MNSTDAIRNPDNVRPITVITGNRHRTVWVRSRKPLKSTDPMSAADQADRRRLMALSDPELVNLTRLRHKQGHPMTANAAAELSSRRAVR